jgi:hypothetical protein
VSLTAAELETFVRDVMARPDDWAHLVGHDPEQRRYELLLRDDQVEVWLICWMADHDTVSRVAGEGESFTFTASDVHRVLHAGDAPAVTIHAYSPPLWRMGAYEIGDGGELRRHSVSYAEELRPPSAA